MSEFNRTKLSIFRKFLAKIGKQLIWWRAPKANALMLNNTILFLYESLHQLIRDREKTDEEWFSMATRGGRSLVSESFNLVELAISKSLEDLIYLVEVAWKAYMGRNPTSITYFPPDEQGVAKIAWSWEDCVICNNAQNILSSETLKNPRIGLLVAGVFQATFQMIQDHVGNAYKVEITDTKSQARGDDCCEMTASFHPV